MSIWTKVVIPTAILAGVAYAAAPAPGDYPQSAPPINIEKATAEFAAEHDLTGCVDPARAFTDDADVVLTIEVDQMMVPTTATIVPVDLEAALESGEHSRKNLTACHTKENTP